MFWFVGLNKSFISNSVKNGILLHATCEYGHFWFILNEWWILFLFSSDKLSIPSGRGPNIFVMSVTWETFQLLISSLKLVPANNSDISVIKDTSHVLIFPYLVSAADLLVANSLIANSNSYLFCTIKTLDVPSITLLDHKIRWYNQFKFVLNEWWILFLFSGDKLTRPSGEGPNIFVMLVTPETSQ